MSTENRTPSNNHKYEIILAFLKVIRGTSPALAAVFDTFLLPEDSERSLRYQATLQIETFSELLELWTAGIAPDLLIQALPYYLGILEHHLTEKGTDDFLYFDAAGDIPLKKEITNYNAIASDLALGKISLDVAISRAQADVATVALKSAETDLTRLFGKFTENPSWIKRLGMWWLDFRRYSQLDSSKGEMKLREALDAPNTFIMVANLQEIAHARENVLDLNKETDGRLNTIADYTLSMLAARYTGGNDLLKDVHVPVESAVKIGTKTVLIGFTYGMGILARASADKEFLSAIEDQQPLIIEAMTNAARIIREMNDASPTALTVWGENLAQASAQLTSLRSIVGLELSPKEFFVRLRECAASNPDLQPYVDFYARQVVDAAQGEYNIGLFARTDVAMANTWESFLHNMSYLSQDFAQARSKLHMQLHMIDRRAADFIGMMIGYHDGLYRFAKGDFDDPRDIEELTMYCAQNWKSGFSADREERLNVFHVMHATALRDGHHQKAELLSGMLATLTLGA